MLNVELITVEAIVPYGIRKIHTKKKSFLDTSSFSKIDILLLLIQM